MKWMLCIGLGFFLWALPANAWAGGGKAAYRNYFLGSYYFAEGQYGRALQHLRRAYELEPNQLNFNLALALALGRVGQMEEGNQLIGRIDHLLNRRHPEYYKILALRHFVAGMIYIHGQLYYRAIPSLKEAVRIQEKLDNPEQLSVMLNALGYADLMDQGKGAVRHDTMGPHYHVHRRDLERSLAYFHQALKADVHNGAAADNYLMLCDTLGIIPDNIAETPREAKPVRYVDARYTYLPANMSGVLDFGAYDEVVFLLDISGSMVMEEVGCMNTDRFHVMRETALYLLDDLAPETQVGVGTIGGDCGTTPRLWYPVGSRDRKDVRSAFEFLIPDGTTPLLTILQQTPELFTNSPETSKTIFFISDGENVCNLPGVDICEWSQLLAQRNIHINILTFLGASLDNTNAFAEYTCLANNTYGNILYLDVDRCSLQRYDFDLVSACHLRIPEFRKVNCWGPSVKDLWAIFPEG